MTTMRSRTDLHCGSCAEAGASGGEGAGVSCARCGVECACPTCACDAGTGAEGCDCCGGGTCCTPTATVAEPAMRPAR